MAPLQLHDFDHYRAVDKAQLSFSAGDDDVCLYLCTQLVSPAHGMQV